MIPTAAPTRRTFVVTLLLVAINAATYGLMAASAPPEHRLEFEVETLIRFGAVYAPGLQEGEWWRLVTGAFLHGSLDHLLWNMISLLFIGRYLEARYAATRYLALYLFAGVASNAVSAAWYWQSDIVQIGASGAISALVGAGAVSALRMGARGRHFRNRMLMWSAVILVNGFVYGSNNVAHASGLIVGAALVVLFGRRGRAALTSRVTGETSFDDAPSLTCARCDAANPLDARYCGGCGVLLQASAITP